MEMAKIWLEGWNVVGWLKYDWNLSGICLEYRLENMAGILMKHGLNMGGIWLENGRNTAGLLLEYGWDKAGIWLG